MGEIRVGCCGFPCARRTYYRRFPVVEVQKTFYEPPQDATLARWRAEAPAGFEFTLKAWQVITHAARSPTYRRMRTRLARPEDAGGFRPNETVFAAWERTRAAARALGARYVVFQCPASFTPTPAHADDMRAFFAAAPREGLVFVWEPRGAWPDALVCELCETLDLVHGVDPFKRLALTPAPAYFRLHGVRGYRSRHDDGDLARLRAWAERYRLAYCLFNNMTMLDDAARLQGRLGGARLAHRPRGR